MLPLTKVARAAPAGGRPRRWSLAPPLPEVSRAATAGARPRWLSPAPPLPEVARATTAGARPPLPPPGAACLCFAAGRDLPRLAAAMDPSEPIRTAPSLDRWSWLGRYEQTGACDGAVMRPTSVARAGWDVTAETLGRELAGRRDGGRCAGTRHGRSARGLLAPGRRAVTRRRRRAGARRGRRAQRHRRSW